MKREMSFSRASVPCSTRADRQSPQKCPGGLWGVTALLLRFRWVQCLLSAPPQVLCPAFLPDSALRNAKAKAPLKLLLTNTHSSLTVPRCWGGLGPGRHTRLFPAWLQSQDGAASLGAGSLEAPELCRSQSPDTLQSSVGVAAIFQIQLQRYKSPASNTSSVHSLPFSTFFPCL